MLCVCKCKWPKWPLARKCCFCVPIRRGITIFGYVNLVLLLLSLPILIFLLVDHLASNVPPPTDNTLDPAIHLPMSIAFMCIDIIMNIILLIGAQKKNKCLLLFFFYFNTGFQIFTICLDLIYFDFSQHGENVVYLLFLCLNIYLLFLVYNAIYEVDESAEVQYVVYQEDRQPINC